MINGTCGCCGGELYREAAKTGDMEALKKTGCFELVFAGVDVGIDKMIFRSHPCLKCTREKSLEKINKFISVAHGAPVVNWSLYAQSGVGYTTDVLVALGVLQDKCNRACIIMSQTQGCLNPKHGSDRRILYFHSPNDAKLYADIVSHCNDFDIMVIAHAL